MAHAFGRELEGLQDVRSPSLETSGVTDMRIFSALIIAAATAVPMVAALPAREASAQMNDRGSSAVGNYGYRDQSGFRSRGEGRSGVDNGRWTRGAVSSDWNRNYGRRDRGYGYRDHGNYGYRSNSGYRPISYGYGSSGYLTSGYSSGYSRGYSYGYAPSGYGYAPVGYGYAPSYGYGSHGYGYRPAVSVGFGYTAHPSHRAYGYGRSHTGHGHTNAHDDCD